MKLNPYNPDGHCPKCGYEEVSTVYHEEVGVTYDCCLWPYHSGEGEHQERKCGRCRYMWAEKTLGQEEQMPQEQQKPSIAR